MSFNLPIDNQSEVSPEAKEELLFYLWEHGFHLIPCGSPSEVAPKYFRSRHPFDSEQEIQARWAKTPRVKWQHYQKIQPSHDEIEHWHKQYPQANWAAITGINFVVVDADSDESVEWVNGGAISRTPLKQTTPRGGSHYLYAVGNSLVRNSAGKNKLDVRGDGGYVMIVPSEGYRWDMDTAYHMDGMEDLPVLGENDLKAIHEFNTGATVENLVREKLTEDPVEPGTRNDTLARLVGKWVKEGWGMREVLIKAQDWNQTCFPPMDLMEVTRTVVSITSGHIKRHPEDVDSGIMKWETSTWEVGLTQDLKDIQSQEDPIDSVEEEKTEGPLGLKPFSAAEWVDLDDSEIELFWGDKFIFENSRILLLGKPKIGKSNWLGGFAAGATTGTDFMDVPFSRPLKVMWLQAEIIAEFLQQRIELYYRRFAASEDLIPMGYNNLIITGRLRKNLMRDGDIQAISDEIAFHQPDIVMIDPVINFFDGEENNNSEIHKLLDRVDLLIELNNVSVMIAHHTGKERADDKTFMSARGGSAFAGWFDSGFKLGGERPDVSFFYEARNAKEPDEHTARFDFNEGMWKMNEFTSHNIPKQAKQTEEDEVKIAQIVAGAMNLTTFYKRNELEMLARETLKKARMPNGNKASQRAVSFVQKYMGDVVKTHADPGKAVWHYLENNPNQKPWEI